MAQTHNPRMDWFELKTPTEQPKNSCLCILPSFLAWCFPTKVWQGNPWCTFSHFARSMELKFIGQWPTANQDLQGSCTWNEHVWCTISLPMHEIEPHLSTKCSFASHRHRGCLPCKMIWHHLTELWQVEFNIHFQNIRTSQPRVTSCIHGKRPLLGRWGIQCSCSIHSWAKVPFCMAWPMPSSNTVENWLVKHLPVTAKALAAGKARAATKSWGDNGQMYWLLVVTLCDIVDTPFGHEPTGRQAIAPDLVPIKSFGLCVPVSNQWKLPDCPDLWGRVGKCTWLIGNPIHSLACTFLSMYQISSPWLQDWDRVWVPKVIHWPPPVSCAAGMTNKHVIFSHCRLASQHLHSDLGSPVLIVVWQRHLLFSITARFIFRLPAHCIPKSSHKQFAYHVSNH